MPLNKTEIIGLIADLKEASAEQMSVQAKFQSKGAAYFAGNHWSRKKKRRSNNFGEVEVDYNPDSTALRVIDNVVTSLAQLSEAATHPFALPVRVRPFDGDMNPQSLGKARAAEFVFEADDRESRRLPSVAYGNFMANIVGSHLIGLTIDRFGRVGSAKDDAGKLIELDEWLVRWCSMPSLSLMLDPGVSSPDLRDHEQVGVRQIFNVRKFEATFGRVINATDRDRLSTIGTLAQNLITVGSASGGSLYGEYIEQSKQKGVEVFFVHRKSGRARDRYDEMYAYWENPKTGELEPVTEESEDAVNPFGYDGLPYALMNYHQRPGTPFGAGATHMMIGPQDNINLHATIFTRGLAYSSIPTWVIDRRTKHKWVTGNRIGGTITFLSGNQHEKVFAPQSIRTADPNPAHIERVNAFKESARTNVHRSPINQGLTKSHVPDASNQAALNESNSVPNIIVEQFAKVIADLHLVELGTKVNAVKSGSLGMIKRWQARGMTQEDFFALRQIDSVEINLKLRIEKDAIRPRAPQSRRAEIMDAANPAVGLLSPIEARRALAADAEMPLTGYDLKFDRFSQKAVERVIAGEDWEAPRFGRAKEHEWMILAFSEALVSINDGDDAVDGRLRKAIEAHSRLQQELAQNEAALQNPQSGVSATAPPPESGGVDLAGASPNLRLSA